MVVVELDGLEQDALDLVALVTNVVLEEHHLVVGVVVIVDPGVIPINSRGEKQRMHLRDGFLADQLDPIYVAYNMWAQLANPQVPETGVIQVSPALEPVEGAGICENTAVSAPLGERIPVFMEHRAPSSAFPDPSQGSPNLILEPLLELFEENF